MASPGTPVSPETHVFEYMRHGFPVLTLEQVTLDDLSAELGAKTLALVENTYVGILETTGLLPEGSVSQYVNSLGSGSDQAERMAAAMNAKSQYWKASFTSGAGAVRGVDGIAGIMKLSPSRSIRQKLAGSPPNAYMNDLLIAPPFQEIEQKATRGTVESALLHVATTRAGFQRDRHFAVHTYVGDYATADKYLDLGLIENPKSERKATFGDSEVAEIVMTTEGSTSIQGLRRALEGQNRWLLSQTATPRA